MAILYHLKFMFPKYLFCARFWENVNMISADNDAAKICACYLLTKKTGPAFF